MSATEPAPAGSESLVNRIKGILLQPRAEWAKIETEPATTQGLYVGYACILAAIPAVARIIGGLFPVCILGVCVSQNPLWVVVDAIVYYVLSLVGIYITALIVDELAPNFGGQKNRMQALKLVVYSWTAAWLAGVAGIFTFAPALSLLGILGLYSLYLLYVGLPVMMKSPEDKALLYTVVSILVAMVVFVAIFFLAGALGGFGRMGGAYTASNSATVTGTMHLPGGASVNLAQLNAAAHQAEASAAQIQAAQNGQPAPAGAVKPVAADALKALLPDSLPSGFARTEVSATSAGAAGLGGSHAEGVYTKGGGQITLGVTDLAAMGAMAALGGAVNIQSSRETATGYERVSTVDGRMTTEEFDNQSHSGKYSVVVDNRFVVEANGSGVAIDDLKGAVGAIGFDRLAGLARNA